VDRGVEVDGAALVPSHRHPIPKADFLFLFRALSSGSSGNAYLLRTDKVALLFEAGVRFPKLEKYLGGEGVSPGALSAVLVSHEHRDHCLAASDLAAEHGVPVCANAEVLKAMGLQGHPHAQVLPVGGSTMFGDVEVTSFPVQHDSVCPVGFLVKTSGRTIAIATDLGHPTGEVAEAVSVADLIVLEANHDTDMLQNGRYPHHLRRRVAGPRGHLSNTQAAGILLKNVRSDDVEVWLAHLSKENNSPTLAMKTVRSYLKSGGLGGLPVAVAQRDKPSLRWTGQARPRQLSLFSTADCR
jgi:phosphoribosyl 1,2-cyclic phosphodiesterase